MKRMKKTSLFITILLITSLIFVGCGGDGNENVDATQNEVYTLKVSELINEENPTHKATVFFKELLEEKSGGRIKVEIFSNGQLASSDRDQLEQVQNNIVQMCMAPTFTMASMSPELNVFNIFDVPYLINTKEDLDTFINSDIGKEIRQTFFEKTGLRLYDSYSGGSVIISSNSKTIRSPEDIKGLDIRVIPSDTYINLVKSWKGNPTPLAWSEVFTALQQGVVDGMMTRTALYYTASLYEVQKYIGCVNPFFMVYSPVLNNDWYESLPEDLKPIVDECMNACAQKAGELEGDFERYSIEQIRATGKTEVTEYTPEELQVFADAAKNTWSKMADIVGGQEYLDRCIEVLNK